MRIFHNLKSWLSPTRRGDKDFGSLLYVHASDTPDGSFWEGESVFSPTGTAVTICLPGDESGPTPESREFYLGLPMRFEQIIAACRPRIAKVFQEWLHHPLLKIFSRQCAFWAFRWRIRARLRSDGRSRSKPQATSGCRSRFRLLGTLRRRRWSICKRWWQAVAVAVNSRTKRACEAVF